MLESQLSDALSGVSVPSDVSKMQEELNKLRAESRGLKQRLKQETDAKKNWQDISKKREDDL